MNKLKKILSSNSGYTLMELLVSVAIIGLISSITLADYKTGGRKANLRMEAQQLMSDIKVMQNNSLALKNFASADLGGGWGIQFQQDENKYTLFVDTNPAAGDGVYTDDDSLYKDVFFNEGITILGKLVIEGSQKKYLAVTFEPPDPKVHITGTPNPGSSPGPQWSRDAEWAEIELADNFGNTETVHINRFGMVEIK